MSDHELTEQERALIAKFAKVTGYDQQATASLLYTYAFMGDYARTRNAVPSIRMIAEGRNQSIRETRHQLAQLSEAGVILNTVQGLRAPEEASS